MPQYTIHNTFNITVMTNYYFDYRFSRVMLRTKLNVRSKQVKIESSEFP